ncbi:O-antigen ligase family protein [Parvibaculum sp.]|uniref:O-antigen ligase family protein n=1 Tax=Parvibaculum sp. TaxID=2024848 RepID=UPI001B1484B9|nr:O-antigen ligase family protein [Parvibaculum sp.]MBO6634173.1 O-antigen ligase family protein [Parvibaculum sp.]MBO6679275.1 O-antigen ligase family protein [Parvibaculum sp.]MBO6685408.1 O-antigen ligase family protein [Parvibaculum sp.]
MTDTSRSGYERRATLPGGGRMTGLARASRSSLPLPVIAIAIGLLLPSTASFYLGNLRIDGTRLVLFAILPALLMRAMSGRFRWQYFDYAILGHAIYMVLAMMVNQGVFGGLKSGGVVAFEAMGGYFCARLCFTNIGAIQKFLKLMASLYVVIVSLLVVEIVTQKNLIRDIFSAVADADFNVNSKSRFGLLRPVGPFPHSIHAGVFCSVFFAMFWVGLRGGSRLVGSLASIVGVGVSLSSGPLLALVMQIGLIVYRAIMKTFKGVRYWRILVIALVIAGTFIQIGSNRGVVLFVIQNITFDGWTAFYRTLIWDFGMDSVMAHPLFGIGFSEWARPGWMHSSVDAFWLLTAMRYGLPCLILMVAGIALIYRNVAISAREVADPRWKGLCLGWVFAMTAFMFAGFTVHFWANLYVLFFFLLGMGASMSEIMQKAIKNGAEPQAKRGRSV